MLALGARDPSMLGHALAGAREASGQTPEQQVAGLGVTVQALAYLSITKVPPPGRRAEGLAVVASRFGLRV